MKAGQLWVSHAKRSGLMDSKKLDSKKSKTVKAKASHTKSRKSKDKKIIRKIWRKLI